MWGIGRSPVGAGGGEGGSEQSFARARRSLTPFNRVKGRYPCCILDVFVGTLPKNREISRWERNEKSGGMGGPREMGEG